MCEMPVDAFSTFSGNRGVQDEAKTFQQCCLAGALATDESVETVAQRNPRLRYKRADDMKAENSGMIRLRFIQGHAMAKG
jgi:hypothetical protein